MQWGREKRKRLVYSIQKKLYFIVVCFIFYLIFSHAFTRQMPTLTGREGDLASDKVSPPRFSLRAKQKLCEKFHHEFLRNDFNLGTVANYVSDKRPSPGTWWMMKRMARSVWTYMPNNVDKVVWEVGLDVSDEDM